MKSLTKIQTEIVGFVRANEGVTKSELRGFQFGTSASVFPAAHAVAELVKAGVLREEKPDHRSAKLFVVEQPRVWESSCGRYAFEQVGDGYADFFVDDRICDYYYSTGKFPDDVRAAAREFNIYGAI